MSGQATDHINLMIERVNSTPEDMPRSNSEADRVWQEFAIASAVNTAAARRYKNAKEAIMDRLPEDLGDHVVHTSSLVTVVCKNILYTQPLNATSVTKAMLDHGIKADVITAILDLAKHEPVVQKRPTATLRK
jgi:hypothetical protein